ncbi:hypothetical protein [Auritidibacter ignavus]|uniref:hypothetical protein n=1 Tax=Auritidibacter ignavus TaxID=678932 RepID=UPI002FE675D3
METWHVELGFVSQKSLDDDVVFDIVERLEDYAAVISVSRDLKSGSLALTNESQSLSSALESVRKAFAECMEAIRLPYEITSVKVQSEAEFDAELNEPVYPPVVAFADIARMAGISRQRVRQISAKPDFPEVVIKTSQGPLYNRYAVKRWLKNRNTTDRKTHTINA